MNLLYLNQLFGSTLQTKITKYRRQTKPKEKKSLKRKKKKKKVTTLGTALPLGDNKKPCDTFIYFCS